MPDVALLDFDNFFDPTWTTDYGNRVFYFDAFLSHNRADNSSSLKTKLESAGLRVWHDSDADLRARKVRIRVAAGIKNSRFVIVCIHDGFSDSPWCRAEYLPALDAAKRCGAQRVLVAQMSPLVVIPATLGHAPVFDCTHEAPAAMLDLLNIANRLTFDPKTVLHQQSRLPTTPSRELEVVIHEAEDWEWHGKDFGSDSKRDARLLTSRVASSFVRKRLENEIDNTGQRMEAYRSLMCKIPADNAQHWPSELLQAVFDFAALVSHASDRDDRVNAIYLFEWLAAAGPRQLAVDAISEMIRKDTDPIVIGEGVKVLERLRVSSDEVSTAVLELAHLRGCSRLKVDTTSYFADCLSDAVRLRCALKGDLIDETFLTANEQLLLIEQRVSFVLEESVYIDLDGVSDQVRIPLQISDLELELRQLRHVMRLFLEVQEQNAAELYERVVRLMRSVAAASEKNKGYPLLAMAEWVLEYVLYPLLHCMLSAHGTRQTAVETFRLVCSVMEASGQVAREVTVYLAGLDVAIDTNDFEHAEEKIMYGLLKIT